MKKGFTIVELLGVVALLAIIGGIGFAVFDGVVHKTRIKAYEEQLENVKAAAKSWMSDVRGTEEFPETFPHNVKLITLYNGKYIETKICNQVDRVNLDFNTSYVEINRSGNNYTYTVHPSNSSEEC